jgi:hypothetical protein
MKHIRISLPEDLARAAEAEGLLAPEKLEPMLRDAIKEKRKAASRDAMAKMAAVNDGSVMNPEDVAAEIAAYRAERRIAQK